MSFAFRSMLIVLLILLGTPTSSAEEADTSAAYFPDDAFDSAWRKSWYSRALGALEEPSIFSDGCKEKRCVRFLWLRTFHKPVSVRIEFSADGTSTLFYKQTDGKGGYEFGRLELSADRDLSVEQTSKIAKLAELAVWDAPDWAAGLDGANWVVEFRDRDGYLVVDAWAPYNSPIHDLGVMLIGLSTFEGAETEPIY